MQLKAKSKVACKDGVCRELSIDIWYYMDTKVFGLFDKTPIPNSVHHQQAWNFTADMGPCGPGLGRGLGRGHPDIVMEVPFILGKK